MPKLSFFSAIDGDVIQNPNIDLLRILILYVGSEYWCSGAGESVLKFNESENKNNSELTIRYYNNLGFALGFSAWQENFYTFNEGNSDSKCTVYVCGEPYYMPQNLFVDASDAYEIIKYFCETGKKHTNYAWIDSSHFDFTEE
jgi:hypothetical protein